MNNDMSSAEKFAWKYIQDNLESIPALSISRLSEKASVSTATIVRALRKNGYKGFIDFKQSIQKQNSPNKYSNLDKVNTDIKTAILKNEHEVSNTIELIKINDIEDAVQAIIKAKKTYIFARGFSELIAKELLVKLQLLNKNCQSSDDPNIIKKISKNITSENLLIIISLNGETPELVQAAEQVAKNKTPVIFITTNPESIISSFSSIVLTGYKSEVTYFPEFEVHSRLPLQVIARILLDAYVIRTTNTKLKSI